MKIESFIFSFYSFYSQLQTFIILKLYCSNSQIHQRIHHLRILHLLNFLEWHVFKTFSSYFLLQALLSVRLSITFFLLVLHLTKLFSCSCSPYHQLNQIHSLMMILTLLISSELQNASCQAILHQLKEEIAFIFIQHYLGKVQKYSEMIYFFIPLLQHQIYSNQSNLLKKYCFLMQFCEKNFKLVYNQGHF